MITHGLQIITSVIGWYALSYHFFLINPVAASLIAAGGILHAQHQMREFYSVFFMVPDMAALKSLMAEHKKNLSKWKVERVKATQADDSTWDITHFEPIGSMYINNVNIELILGLLNKQNEINDDYNIDDYKMLTVNNVIYVLGASDDMPLYRLESDVS